MNEELSEGAVATPRETPPVRGAAVIFIFITILLDMFALGLIMPILPKLVESFLDNDTASAARVFGLFGTAWAAMQFFCAPILGSLSDRFGRRPVILLSNLGLGLDYISYEPRCYSQSYAIGLGFVGKTPRRNSRVPSRPKA